MQIALESEAPETAASEDRHSRKCTICNHPDREAIDEAFLHWSPAHVIVFDFSLRGLSCLYRHAHACGLWVQRRSKIRYALDRIIEQASGCHATASSILRAIEMSCRFDKDDHYNEPQKRAVVEHRAINPEPIPNQNVSKPDPNPTPANQPIPNQISNRQSHQLENNVTTTKQSPDPDSNRQNNELFPTVPITTLTPAIQDMLIGRA